MVEFLDENSSQGLHLSLPEIVTKFAVELYVVSTRFGDKDTLFGQNEINLLKIQKSGGLNEIELNLDTSDGQHLLATLYISI